MIRRRDALFGLVGASTVGSATLPQHRPYGAKGDFRLSADWTFGTSKSSSTVTNLSELQKDFYFKYIYDNGRLDRMSYEWSRHSVYPAGDPRSLHVFTDHALTLKGRIPRNGGFWPGGLEAGLLRAKIPLRPGVYIELKAKLPRGIGLLPAFWMVPGAQYSDIDFVLPPWPPEIDIFEFLQFPSRPRPTVMESNIEVKGEPAKFGFPHDLFSKFVAGKYDPGIDFSADYHVFALDWVVDQPIWVLDGVPVKQTFYKWGDAPAQLLVSNQIGLTLPGLDISGMSSGDRDWDFSIEYLRLWQRAS